MLMPGRVVAQQSGLNDEEIEITLESMGIAGSFRPGSYVPIRLEIRNRLDVPTPVQIVFEVPNNDGDTDNPTGLTTTQTTTSISPS